MTEYVTCSYMNNDELLDTVIFIEMAIRTDFPSTPLLIVYINLMETPLIRILIMYYSVIFHM
jgi:hypothetical protein